MEVLALVTRAGARRAGRRLSQAHRHDEQAQAGTVVEVAKVVRFQNILQGELAKSPCQIERRAVRKSHSYFV